MSRNGSGTYSLPAGNPVVTGTVVSSTWANTTLSDLASALTQSVAADGQTPITGDQNMGGFKHTNVDNASNITDYAAAGQVQNSAFNNAGTFGGTGDVITLTVTPSFASYVDGQIFYGIAASANTGATTANVNGKGAKNVYFAGAALAASTITSSHPYGLRYNGSSDRFDLMPITDSFLAANSIGTSQIQDGAVTNAKLAAGAVKAVNTDPDLIHGQTAQTTPTLTDELIDWSSASSALRKMTPDNFLKVINLLTQDTNPDSTADFLLSYDTSAGAVKKVTPQSLALSSNIIASGNISTVGDTSISVPAGAWKNINLHINNLTAATAYVLFLRFNADTGNNYYWSYSGASAGNGLIDHGDLVGGIALTRTDSSAVGTGSTNPVDVTLTIANPASAINHNVATTPFLYLQNNGVTNSISPQGRWAGAAAITSIQVLLRATLASTPTGATVNAATGTWYITGIL